MMMKVIVVMTTKITTTITIKIMLLCNNGNADENCGLSNSIPENKNDGNKVNDDDDVDCLSFWLPDCPMIHNSTHMGTSSNDNSVSPIIRHESQHYTHGT